VYELSADFIVNNNVTNDRDDWRFMGQDEYLMNVSLMKHNFDNSIRDHDHCDFCTKTFGTNIGDLHEGYCTLDKDHWICEGCYKDFKDMFNWTVIEE
jgi:hypothetical protein